MNLICSLFQTWILQTTAGKKSSSNWEKIQFIKLENCKNQVQIDRRKDSCFQFIAVLNLLTGGRTMFFTFLVVFWGAQKFIDIFFFFIHVYQSSVNWLEPCLEEDLYLKINRDQMIFLFFCEMGEDIFVLKSFLILSYCPALQYLFSNFSCMFLNPNDFFQFEF